MEFLYSCRADPNRITAANLVPFLWLATLHPRSPHDSVLLCFTDVAFFAIKSAQHMAYAAYNGTY